MSESVRSALRTLLIVVAAAVILAAVVVSYVYLNEKPPAAAGQVVKVTVTPIHSQMRLGTATQGLVGGLDTYDQLIVQAEVEIRNRSKSPVRIDDMWGDLSLHDGNHQRSLAAPEPVFAKVSVAYPQVPRTDLPPVLRDAIIQPGQSIHGAMIFNYPITQQDWDARQSFYVAISFQNQANLVLRVPQ